MVVLNKYEFNGLKAELEWNGFFYSAEVHFPDGTLDFLGEYDSKAEAAEQILNYALCESYEEPEEDEEEEEVEEVGYIYREFGDPADYFRPEV